MGKDYFERFILLFLEPVLTKVFIIEQLLTYDDVIGSLSIV